jgi:hypothetical protein
MRSTTRAGARTLGLSCASRCRGWAIFEYGYARVRRIPLNGVHPEVISGRAGDRNRAGYGVPYPAWSCSYSGFPCWSIALS